MMTIFVIIIIINIIITLSGLERLDDRRENITEQMFRQIKSPTHPLHSLLPLQRCSKFLR